MSLRRRAVFGATAVAAVGAGVGAALWRFDVDRNAADDLSGAIWALRFPRPEGGELALADFRHRPLLINFWATWCPPCVRELPDIDRFARERAAHGLGALALAIDTKEPVQQFLHRMPLSIPVGLCRSDCSGLLQELGNSHGALPFTVLLARDGHVRRRKLGETHYDELVMWFESISS